MRNEKQSLLTITLFAVYILLMSGIILFKLPFQYAWLSDGSRAVNLIPLQGSYDANGVINWTEITLNVLIFVPFGVYLCMHKNTWSLGAKAFAIFSLTLAFEVAQFVFALGRSDIQDIIGNTLGGLIGIGGYALLQKVLGSWTNRVINMLAFAVTVCVIWCFTGIMRRNYFI